MTNHDIRNTLCIDYPFSVEYGGDINAMRAVFLEEAASNPQILAAPEPTVMVEGVTAAGIDMISRLNREPEPAEVPRRPVGVLPGGQGTLRARGF